MQCLRNYLQLSLTFSKVTMTRFLIMDVIECLERSMDKKLLLQDDNGTQRVKEICMMRDAQKLQMILGKLSWRILALLYEREMYPLEIARELGVHEQLVYSHLRRLAKAGAITVERRGQ